MVINNIQCLDNQPSFALEIYTYIYIYIYTKSECKYVVETHNY